MPLNSEETGGRFRVWLFLDGQPPALVWDRKVEGGFPELKLLVSIHAFSEVAGTQSDRRVTRNNAYGIISSLGSRSVTLTNERLLPHRHVVKGEHTKEVELETRMLCIFRVALSVRVPIAPVRNMWEYNYCPDVPTFTAINADYCGRSP